MSVETWQQGQSNQRARTLIASGTANSDVPDSLFLQPERARAPAKQSRGEPPAQGQSKGTHAGTKANDQMTPPSSRDQGE
jgi:hypothetical protein